MNLDLDHYITYPKLTITRIGNQETRQSLRNKKTLPDLPCRKTKTKKRGSYLGVVQIGRWSCES
jgi:hypothetical protein